MGPSMNIFSILLAVVLAAAQGPEEPACYCYTSTVTKANPTCPPFTGTCGPHPDCAILSTKTLPPAVTVQGGVCSSTPTVTVTGTDCPSPCQTGCETVTTTAKACYTATTTSFTGQNHLTTCGPVPQCIIQSMETVPPHWCACPSTPTATVKAQATCQTGCATQTVTVAANPSGY